MDEGPRERRRAAHSRGLTFTVSLPNEPRRAIRRLYVPFMQLSRILSCAAVTVALPLTALAAPAAASPTGSLDWSGSFGSSAPQPVSTFDVQAHRGGLGLYTESSLAAFANALEMGVSTLELDTQITEDGIAVVTHDRKISNKKCLDTEPATAGDPEFPYVGKFVNTLSLQQIKTMDCGTLPLAGYPEQQNVPGAKCRLPKRCWPG